MTILSKTVQKLETKETLLTQLWGKHKPTAKPDKENYRPVSLMFADKKKKNLQQNTSMPNPATYENNNNSKQGSFQENKISL